MRRAALAAVLALASVGCSAIPPGGDPAQDVRAGDEPPLGRIAIAPVATLTMTDAERAKLWLPSEVFDAAELRRALLSGVKAAATFADMRLADSGSLGEAWQNGDDYVLSVSIEQIRTKFDDYTGMRYPNMFIWFMWLIPSWYVATEIYSLELDARVLVTSGHTGAALLEFVESVRVEGRFDEFDRGWQFFGFISPSLEADNWRKIAAALEPAARRRLAAQVAQRLDRDLRAAATTAEFAAKQRKTLVVGVGVTRYADPIGFAPARYAADDARAVADRLAERGIPREHMIVLVDNEATIAAVTTTLTGHLGRARPGDTILVHLAGMGTRRQDGAPGLLCHDASRRDDGGCLFLADLAALLARLPGEKLVVVDAAFDGRTRSMARGKATGDEMPYARLGSAWILAGGRGEPAVAPDHLGHGLLTYHFLDALSGRADQDHDERLTAREIYLFVEPRVAAEAGVLGAKQVPRASNLERGFGLRFPAGHAGSN